VVSRARPDTPYASIQQPSRFCQIPPIDGILYGSLLGYGTRPGRRKPSTFPSHVEHRVRVRSQRSTGSITSKYRVTDKISAYSKHVDPNLSKGRGLDAQETGGQLTWPGSGPWILQSRDFSASVFMYTIATMTQYTTSYKSYQLTKQLW
jgi:hypothetical protein